MCWAAGGLHVHVAGLARARRVGRSRKTILSPVVHAAAASGPLGGGPMVEFCVATLSRLGMLRGLMALPTGDPDLLESQARALSRQIPLLYAILTINAVALAFTHAHTAPLALTVVVPVLLFCACLVRAVSWLRQSKHAMTSAQAVRRLKVTMGLAPVLGLGFTAWSLSLYPYGDAYAQCHVAFYMAYTAMGCIFCLMHLRSAALVLMGVVLVPFTMFFCIFGNFVMKAIALNLLLVSAVMVLLLLRNYADFADLIVSKRELLARQAEAHLLSEENGRLANLDALTGLPNRRLFLTKLDEMLQDARREGKRFALALIDLDRFKSVNDVYGHAAGDRLLAEVGARLTRLVGPLVKVGRLGGDEFVAMIEGDPDDDAVQAFGDELCAALQGPYRVGDSVSDTCGSAGLVVYPRGGETAEQLFERADYALYYAKQSHTGQAVLFSEKHATMIRDAVQLEMALLHADLEKEMWLAFQPMVDAASNRTIGFEALARWNSPALGPVAPDVFIPLAERSGMVCKLTEKLFVKALAAAAGWQPELRISFNLSAQDVVAPHIVETVRRIVAQSGVSAGRIDLEITETAVMRDFNAASEALTAFRAMGLRVSLDDFGTGYSSLSHVHRLKPDKIKIDRSFVAGIKDDRTSRDIVRTIVDLCHTLDMGCVVEGVETEAQMRILTSLGCRVMQGYYFSRPMPGHEVARYLGTEMGERARVAAAW
jgi:diguanylate cyclase (GGDEF)-like protein